MEGIAGEIATTFDLHSQEVLSQVQETVAQFKSMGLLESGDDASRPDEEASNGHERVARSISGS